MRKQKKRKTGFILLGLGLGTIATGSILGAILSVYPKKQLNQNQPSIENTNKKPIENENKPNNDVVIETNLSELKNDIKSKLEVLKTHDLKYPTNWNEYDKSESKEYLSSLYSNLNKYFVEDETKSSLINKKEMIDNIQFKTIDESKVIELEDNKTKIDTLEFESPNVVFDVVLEEYRDLLNNRVNFKNKLVPNDVLLNDLHKKYTRFVNDKKENVFVNKWNEFTSKPVSLNSFDYNTLDLNTTYTNVDNHSDPNISNDQQVDEFEIYYNKSLQVIFENMEDHYVSEYRENGGFFSTKTNWLHYMLMMRHFKLKENGVDLIKKVYETVKHYGEIFNTIKKQNIKLFNYSVRLNTFLKIRPFKQIRYYDYNEKQWVNKTLNNPIFDIYNEEMEEYSKVILTLNLEEPNEEQLNKIEKSVIKISETVLKPEYEVAIQIFLLLMKSYSTSFSGNSIGTLWSSSYSRVVETRPTNLSYGNWDVMTFEDLREVNQKTKELVSIFDSIDNLNGIEMVERWKELNGFDKFNEVVEEFDKVQYKLSNSTKDIANRVGTISQLRFGHDSLGRELLSGFYRFYDVLKNELMLVSNSQDQNTIDKLHSWINVSTNNISDSYKNNFENPIKKIFDKGIKLLSWRINTGPTKPAIVENRDVKNEKIYSGIELFDDTQQHSGTTRLYSNIQGTEENVKDFKQIHPLHRVIWKSKYIKTLNLDMNNIFPNTLYDDSVNGSSFNYKFNSSWANDNDGTTRIEKIINKFQGENNPLLRMQKIFEKIPTKDDFKTWSWINHLHRMLFIPDAYINDALNNPELLTKITTLREEIFNSENGILGSGIFINKLNDREFKLTTKQSLKSKIQTLFDEIKQVNAENNLVYKHLLEMWKFEFALFDLDWDILEFDVNDDVDMLFNEVSKKLYDAMFGFTNENIQSIIDANTLFKNKINMITLKTPLTQEDFSQFITRVDYIKTLLNENVINERFKPIINNKSTIALKEFINSYKYKLEVDGSTITKDYLIIFLEELNRLYAHAINDLIVYNHDHFESLNQDEDAFIEYFNILKTKQWDLNSYRDLKDKEFIDSFKRRFNNEITKESYLFLSTYLSTNFGFNHYVNNQLQDILTTYYNIENLIKYDITNIKDFENKINEKITKIYQLKSKTEQQESILKEYDELLSKIHVSFNELENFYLKLMIIA